MAYRDAASRSSPVNKGRRIQRLPYTRRLSSHSECLVRIWKFFQYDSSDSAVYRSMSRDPVAYPDPDRFMPERYLKGGKMDPEARDPLKFQFGFGRR